MGRFSFSESSFHVTVLTLHTLASEVGCGFICDWPYFYVSTLDDFTRWSFEIRNDENFDELIDEVLEAMVDCSAN